jgi:membrane-bound lytic murein transglycosylase B
MIKRLMLVIVGAISLCRCALFKPNPALTPTAVSKVVKTPFDYAPTVDNFQDRYKRLDIVRDTIHNQFVQRQVDTLIHLKHRATQLSFYQRNDGKQLFYNAVITSPQLPLKNGVQIGMERSEFEQCFTDLNQAGQNPVSINRKEDGNVHYYHFEEGELSKIVIEQYID